MEFAAFHFPYPDREIRVRYELIEAKTLLKTVSEKKELVKVVIKRGTSQFFLEHIPTQQTAFN